MMKKVFKKKIEFILILFVFVFFININTFSLWLYSDVHNGIAWINPDSTFPVNQWYLIDEDGDGVGYYYYFDENGMLLLDNIAPDYRIVNQNGQRLLMNGEVETVGSVIKTDEGVFIDESDKDSELYQLAQKNSLVSLMSNKIIANELVEKVKDNEFDVATNFDKNLTSSVILGKNVVIVEEKETFDPEIDRDVTKYIKNSNSFSKKVNGTTFTKVKWKGAMALKGNESFVDFENPQNNFNRIRGRVATHHFTYSDRTTVCSIEVFADGEEVSTISGFDYNGGISFDVIFPRKTKTLRLYLSVEGQYPTRTVYLRDVKYSFNKVAFKEELEEDEERAEWERILREADPNYKPDSEYDTTETETEAESEAEEPETNEAGNTKDEEENNKKTGPSFDKDLNATKSEVLGPDGQAERRLIPAK